MRLYNHISSWNAKIGRSNYKAFNIQNIIICELQIKALHIHYITEPYGRGFRYSPV